MLDFARRLSDYEAKGRESTQPPPAHFRACERLCAHLATLTGKDGVRELRSCALERAKAEVDWLRVVKVKEDGGWEGFEELRAQRSREELLRSEAVLLAQLLGLLVAFIGERLTLGQVRETWPRFPLNASGFGKNDQDESTH
jgi:hypothetical protein